jgi:hypothetical protein
MPSCFVVMGFNEKTAYYGGKKKPRILNLDMTYENVIKPAVLAAGYSCMRADEIMHSGMIDKPMYEHLLEADVVVADLSTSNANALYELGVRHALRPHTTIVMAEEEFAFPFDVARLNILRYKHLGSDIGASESRRATGELTRRLQAIAARGEIDSPVYLFLPQLRRDQSELTLTDRPRKPSGPSLADLQAAFAKAKRAASQPSDWLVVVSCLEAWQLLQPGDPFIIQQLALATYCSDYPDKLTALTRAREILEVLTPGTSDEPQIVFRWGAIHKRLWELRRSKADLDEAIHAYQRGFVLNSDVGNGINYAYMLNVRASLLGGEEAVEDRVMAKRVRREVLALCDELLRQKRSDQTSEDEYWVRATRVEALFGLGREAEFKEALKDLEIGTPEKWMVETTMRQIEHLQNLLE